MPEKFKNPWLMHSWGKSPEQKAKEKAYNHEYYLKNKDRRAKASAARAKAYADSEKARMQKSMNNINRTKIEEMHRDFMRGQEKRDQQKYMDESMAKARTSNDNKRRQREASRQQQYKDASQNVARLTQKSKKLRNDFRNIQNNIVDMNEQLNRIAQEARDAAVNADTQTVTMMSGYGGNAAPYLQIVEEKNAEYNRTLAKLEQTKQKQRLLSNEIKRTSDALEEAKSSPYLKHSWGKSPEQKAKEKAYNHEYYLKNKNKWKTIYNDTQSQFGSKVDELNRSISGAEARVSATKDAYDKSVAAYRKGLSDYQSFLNSIPKVGSERTSEQNRMLEDRQNKMRELKSEVDKTEQTYRNAQNDLKSQMSERDQNQRQIDRIRQRSERAESDYNNYENSEAGESERYRREMKALRTRRNKNEEAIQKRWGEYDKSYKELRDDASKTAYNIKKNLNPQSASEAQALAAARSRAKKLSNKMSNMEKQAALDPGMKEYMQRNADRSETADQMRALASKRRASAMARNMQAQQQQTQANRQAFQKQQSSIEQQANKDISSQKARATTIQRQMKATQDRVSKLMSELQDGMSKGYDKSNKVMQTLASQIQAEQNKLAQQRQQLNTVNTTIKTLEKKAKQAHSNI